ncbi:MAG: hypothetical protein JXA71_12010 [Chitinispirillaceae bacterium]|nr:hypothetical protein [Chitinispirillaceae bacterium]
MTRRTAVIIFGVLAVTLVAGWRLLVSDKQQAVERLLADGAAAIENSDLDRLDKLISPFYKDNIGFTYPTMRGNFSYVFREFRDIRVSRRIQEIKVGGDTVTAEVGLWITGTWMGRPGDMVGTENTYEPVTIYCSKELFRWKVIGTRWDERIRGAMGDR